MDIEKILKVIIITVSLLLILLLVCFGAARNWNELATNMTILAVSVIIISLTFIHFLKIRE